MGEPLEKSIRVNSRGGGAGIQGRTRQRCARRERRLAQTRLLANAKDEGRKGVLRECAREKGNKSIRSREAEGRSDRRTASEWGQQENFR